MSTSEEFRPTAPSDAILSPLPPSAFNGHAAVRGMNQQWRPFIAMRVEYLDFNKKKIAETVAFIYKQFSSLGLGKRGEPYENTWMSNSLANPSSAENLALDIKDLLDGKMLNLSNVPTFPNHQYVRLAQS